MKIKKKISFDFDSTLDNEHVQKYAKDLMNDYEIHIVTSRPSKWIQRRKSKDKSFTVWYNEDLHEIAKMIGIERENIHFMFNFPKYEFFKDKENFLFHLDDNHTEVYEINKYTKTKAILFDDNWEDNCNEILKS